MDTVEIVLWGFRCGSQERASRSPEECQDLVTVTEEKRCERGDRTLDE